MSIWLPLYNEDRDLCRETDIGRCSDGHRSEFRRDYARLVHSLSFRRLQGKTQLFPVAESDFFRNRMTHSIEVAQIAKSIANKLNHEQEQLDKRRNGHPIDTDLVEFAALAHDLGHPPFGHNGESTLNDLMAESGGFEGNAQTLRILTKTEKKEDAKAGLNLTFRTLASVLKYDSKIPACLPSGDKLHKGYYASESDVVSAIKEHVFGSAMFFEGFKTIECHIMDIADDIAYSTYDLEDALKAGFLTPLDILGPSEALLDKVASKVERKCPDMGITQDDVRRDLADCLPREEEWSKSGEATADTKIQIDVSKPRSLAKLIVAVREFVDDFARSGYHRSKVTSRLVSEAIQSIVFRYNPDIPGLSVADFSPDRRRKIEVLKNFVYCSVIESPRIKIAEYRGKEMVREIFEALTAGDGYLLLPDDYKEQYDAASKPDRRRVVCDFIAGMTDRYAIEFYGRLKSENPQTIFKPF